VSDSNSSRGWLGTGLGFWSVLGLLFITLKLCGMIDWYWVWVLVPLWGPLAAVIGILCLVLMVLCFASLVKAVSRKKRSTEPRTVITPKSPYGDAPNSKH